MITEADLDSVADAAARELPLESSALPDVYYYASLTLCVIDAVFSIGVRYEVVEQTVKRYCEHYGLPRICRSRMSAAPSEPQEPVASLVERIVAVGPERFAGEVLKNRQRTSARGGILKSEAVLRFAQGLVQHGVQGFQDVTRAASDGALESAIRQIPGQRSGISLQYFWMLAGSDDLIKPDRMIHRYLERVLGRTVSGEDAQEALGGAADRLRRRWSHVTPRLLDYEIWTYQRSRGVPAKSVPWDRADYQAALAEVELLMEREDLSPGAPDYERLVSLAALVEQYEDREFPIPPASRRAVMDFMREQNPE